MTDKLRWGVLSTADIGLQKTLPGLQRSERGEVAAIGSRDQGRAQKAADELGIPRAYGSYEELLADPDIDAVYNPLPNHLHARWTLEAARAGKHVLCEKPLAMDVEEAQGMIDGCREAGILLGEGFMYRLHPQWVRVREILAAGTLGDIHAVQVMFTYNNNDPDDIRNQPEMGGGGLMDIGCYCIDVARMVMGGVEPTGGSGLVRVDPDFGTDVLATAILSFEGDRHASFTCATRSSSDQRVHILGSEAHLTVEVPFNAPPDQQLRLLLSDGWPGNEPTVELIPAADQYALEGDAFAAAVLDGADLGWLAPESGLEDLRILTALRDGRSW